MALSDTLPEVIRLSIHRILMSFHTAMPGSVVSYNTATQTANIRPQLKILSNLPRSTKALVDLPILPNVPVVWPGGGDLGIHAPLAADDTVLLIFCDRSIDLWRSSTGSRPVDPGDHRNHSLTGAVALPLLRRTVDTWATLGLGSTINIGQDGTALQFVALANLVLAELQSIQTQFNSHVHTSAAPASPTSPPTVPMTAPSSVAATKVKVN